MGKKDSKKPPAPDHPEEEWGSSDSEHEREVAALNSGPGGEGLRINNTEALLQRLDDTKLGGPNGLPWVETLIVKSAFPAQSKVENVHDDLKRELTFYELAMHAVNEAQTRCAAQGLPFRRPTDYYAEMVKSDQHMEKVKHKLLEEQQSYKLAEERRKQREARKFGKKVQTEKTQAKHAEKREHMDSIKKWREERKASGAEGSGLPLDLDAPVAGKKRKGGEEERTPFSREAEKEARIKRRKREAKDQKFGSGAKAKKAAKRNDTKSAHDMSDFSMAKNKKSPRGVRPSARGGGPGARGAGPKRGSGGKKRGHNKKR